MTVIVSGGGTIDSNNNVKRGGLDAVRTIYIADSEKEGMPILMSCIGPKEIVRAINAKAQIKSNRTSEGQAGFFFENDVYKGKFKLPDKISYQGFTKKIEGAELYELRLVNLLATDKATSQTECYVLTNGEIRPEGTDQEIKASWREYLVKVRAGHPEIGNRWQRDLYKVYQFIAARVDIGMYPEWMPYLFSEMRRSGFRDHDSRKYVYNMRFIGAEVDEILLEKSAGKNLTRGAYHLNFGNMASWRTAIAENPDRAEGITFQTSGGQ